jgi:hypothetical protein
MPLPTRFSPHDLRHLFVSEYLIRLKIKCGLGTEQFDSERYRSEREAFGSQVMNWRSARTIDIYDQSRNGEAVFSTLAEYQRDLSQRSYAVQPTLATDYSSEQGASPATPQSGVSRESQDTVFPFQSTQQPSLKCSSLSEKLPFPLRSGTV